MEAILKEYNRLSATHLSTMRELEKISEVAQRDTIGGTTLEMYFRRLCSCRAEDSKHNLNLICYYALDVEQLDEHGVVAGNLVTIQYGLLRVQFVSNEIG